MRAFVLFGAALAVIYGGGERTVPKQMSLKTWEISPVLEHHKADKPQAVLPIHLIDSVRQLRDSVKFYT